MIAFGLTANGGVLFAERKATMSGSSMAWEYEPDCFFRCVAKHISRQIQQISRAIRIGGDDLLSIRSVGYSVGNDGEVPGARWFGVFQIGGVERPRFDLPVVTHGCERFTGR